MQNENRILSTEHAQLVMQALQFLFCGYIDTIH